MVWQAVEIEQLGTENWPGLRCIDHPTPCLSEPTRGPKANENLTPRARRWSGLKRRRGDACCPLSRSNASCMQSYDLHVVLNELAQEIADDLQSSYEQFGSIAEKVKG
jgi:hypothetical protein